LLLVTVVEARSEDREGSCPGASWRYEIETPRPETFGILRAIRRGAGAPFEARVGDVCFRALYGRDRPCDACPALPATAHEEVAIRRSIVLRSDEPLRLDVVSAEARPGACTLTAFSVDEELLSGLLRKKVAVLATRSGLSEREKAVLDLLLLGRSHAEVSLVLAISARTVKYHQRNIQKKLGLDSRLDLTRLLI
jgi:DNA-binding CsgD family transcriptional regulator